MSGRSVPGTPEGILLVDKPAGWTSHDVVARVRRLTGQRRAGHTGTLDPAATGLLVVCLGRATRLVEFMTGHDKRYTGTIALGTTTATDDAEGEILATRAVPLLDRATLQTLARQFTGRVAQVPPAHSAVKVGGQRAYAIARRGGEPALPPRQVDIFSIDLQPAGPDRLAIRVHCGPGTYIRSLARDIGASLGCGAHLSGLRRTAAGHFRVDQAWSLEELERLGSAGRLSEALLPADEGVLDLPALILTRARGESLTRGTMLPPQRPGWRHGGPARVYDAEGTFLAIGDVAPSGAIRGRKVLVGV